jgi:uncharacterized protein YeaO (DUF488 family)
MNQCLVAQHDKEAHIATGRVSRLARLHAALEKPSWGPAVGTKMNGMQINTRRIYSDTPRDDDGVRILVDKLWPRGVSKASASIDYWAKQTAPSNDLRHWYQHDPKKWDEFRNRYFTELDANPGAVAELRAQIADGPVTFLFASREEQLNNASALIEYLSSHA